jgi:hypothetical protein
MSRLSSIKTTIAQEETPGPGRALEIGSSNQRHFSTGHPSLALWFCFTVSLEREKLFCVQRFWNLSRVFAMRQQVITLIFTSISTMRKDGFLVIVCYALSRHNSVSAKGSDPRTH